MGGYITGVTRDEFSLATTTVTHNCVVLTGERDMPGKYAYLEEFDTNKDLQCSMVFKRKTETGSNLHPVPTANTQRGDHVSPLGWSHPFFQVVDIIRSQHGLPISLLT